MTLATYLTAAMLAWAHVPADCVKDGAACVSWEHWHHEPVAAARARYAEIGAQMASEGDRNPGSGQYAREALDLMAIAFEESGFDRLVDDFTCNSPELMKGMHVGWDCDGGRARSMWQLLDDAEATPDDRTVAIGHALALYRRHPASWMTWGRARALAAAWWARHPFTQ